MKTLKPNDKRAKIAITLIWIVMGLEILSLLSSYLQANLLNKFLTGETLAIGEGDTNDIREQIIGLLYTIVYIASAVTFIMWFRRAYYNLHQKVTYLSYGEGWAAGAWFVPILNWFRPLQIMNDLYRYTPEFLAKHNINVAGKLKMGILGIWWTLWVGNNIFGNVLFQISRKATGIEDYILVTNLSMISHIIGIPLAILAVKVISDYSKVEPLLFEVENGEMTDSFDIGSSSTLLDD